MLSPECVKDLNELMNHFRSLGTQYQSFQTVFEKENDTGVSTFLKVESNERYRMAEKIEKFISLHHNNVVFTDVLSPSSSEKASQTLLQQLVDQEKHTLSAISNKIDAAFKRSAFVTHAFLVGIYNWSYKEFYETTMVSSRIGELVNDPLGLIYYNEYLEKKYGKQSDNPRKKYY